MARTVNIQRDSNGFTVQGTITKPRKGVVVVTSVQYPHLYAAGDCIACACKAFIDLMSPLSVTAKGALN